METTVKRRWRSPNGKRVTSRLVFQRYAALKGISERTAEDYFSGRSGPFADVLAMASVAANADRTDMVERFHAQLREVSKRPQDLTSELIYRTQRADLVEDQFEETFRLNRCRQTWLALRRAKLLSLALEHDMIAAADREYC